MFCAKCGAEMADSSKFCDKCGAPNPNMQNVTSSGNGVSPKSRLAATLLGFFLGGFGIHNFYLGKVGKGVAQLVLNILTWVLMFAGLIAVAPYADAIEEADFSQILGPAMMFIVACLIGMVVSIWVLVDWIIIVAGGAKDKNGLKVKNW